MLVLQVQNMLFHDEYQKLIPGAIYGVYGGKQGVWAHNPYTCAFIAVVTSSTPTSAAVVIAGGLSCVPMKLAPPSFLCTSEVRWDLDGAFFALYFYSAPRAPQRWGQCGFCFVILIHFPGCFVYYFLKLYHGVTLYGYHRDWSRTCAQTLHPS